MKRRGNCYVTCEALYHLLGGRRAGLVPHRVRFGGDVHWYLVDTRTGTVIDPTRSQFGARAEDVPYGLGKGSGFLTVEPSRRARELMEKMVWQEAVPHGVGQERRSGTNGGSRGKA